MKLDLFATAYPYKAINDEDLRWVAPVWLSVRFPES